MANIGVYRSEYFLPTQGVNSEQGKRDLQRLFGQPGRVCSIADGFWKGRSGLYVRASLELSSEVIKHLVGKTITHLERLEKIETGLMTSEPTMGVSSAHRASVVASTNIAGYQTHTPSMSGPASQSTYDQFSSPGISSSHRRESDAGDRRTIAGPQGDLHNRSIHVHGGPATNTFSYSGSQYYRSHSPERGQNDERSPSGPGPISQSEPHDDEDGVSSDATAYEGRNDAFYFPPNSVSALEIQKRREMIKRPRGGVDR